MPCFYCKRSQTLHICSKCSKATYCNIDCQLNDWERHKKVCGSDQYIDNTYKDNKPNINQFHEEITIGEGNFSLIREVTSSITNVSYALKIINIVKAEHNQKEPDILMEKHCLLTLDSLPNVVKLFGTFASGSNAYILMEYIRGKELWEQCRSFGLCSEALTRYFFHHILTAIQSIHQKGIIHRDLKVN